MNEAIEALNLEILLAQYEGGGTPSHHPKMMLKVLVYAYCKKIYTSCGCRADRRRTFGR